MTMPSFPTEVLCDTAMLRDRFTRFEHSEGEPQPYHFSLTVPADWHSLPVRHDLPCGLSPLARLGTTNGPRAEVRVDVVTMDRDVNPADWLDIAHTVAGAQILHRRDAFGPQGKVSDMLVRCRDDSGSTIRRVMIVKDGSRMFRVETQAAEPAYGELAEDLLVCLTSFALLHPNGVPTAEPVVNEFRDGTVPFTFRRLESWPVLELAHDGGDKMLQLTSRHEGEAVGRITVEIRRKSSTCELQAVARSYAERLKSEGFHLHGAAVVPMKPPERFRAASVFAPSVSYAGHAFDSPVLLFEHDEALVLLALLGPTRQESPEWWAINKRAFEIVRDSLQILDTPGP